MDATVLVARFVDWFTVSRSDCRLRCGGSATWARRRQALPPAAARPSARQQPPGCRRPRSETSAGSWVRYLCHCMDSLPSRGRGKGTGSTLSGRNCCANRARRRCTVAIRSVPRTRKGAATKLKVQTSMRRSMPRRFMNQLSTWAGRCWRAAPRRGLRPRLLVAEGAGASEAAVVPHHAHVLFLEQRFDRMIGRAIVARDHQQVPLATPQCALRLVQFGSGESRKRTVSTAGVPAQAGAASG